MSETGKSHPPDGKPVGKVLEKMMIWGSNDLNAIGKVNFSPDSKEPDSKEKGKKVEFLELWVNPETFSVQYAVSYDTSQAKGSKGAIAKWQSTSPRKLSFDFLLDSTGAIPNANTTNSVPQKINEIELVLYSLHSADKKNLNQPNYLWIQWGNFGFRCRLDSMSIVYKLFNPFGEPVRANISVSFTEIKWEISAWDTTPPPKVVTEEQNNNADKKPGPDGGSGDNDVNGDRPPGKDSGSLSSSLTPPGQTPQAYVIPVEDGSRFTQICKDVLGKANYAHVAIKKKLVHFRNLQAGSNILMSRIDDLDG